MIRISCQHPLFLVNSKVRFLPSGTLVSLQGLIRPLMPLEYSMLLEGKNVFKVFSIGSPRNLSYEFCDQFFFILPDSSVVDMFMAVPCRQCSACRCSYVSSIRQRLLCELQNYRVPPLFVTLTYNDRSLPSNRDVKRRDVQLFLKRLRQFCYRRYQVNIKYYYVSEYTPVTKRPHYHLIIFGIPYFSNNPVLNQYIRFHLIQFCWRYPVKGYKFEDYRRDYPVIFKRHDYYDPQSYGFVDVSEMSSLKCVNYLMKYMHKNVDDVLVTEVFDELRPGRCLKKRSRYFTSDYHRRNFRGSSINLGVDFVRQHVLPNDSRCVFTDWLSRRVQDFRICGYYLSKLFPSFSKLVAVDIRRAFYNAIYSINVLLNCQNIHRKLLVPVLHTKEYLLNNFSDLFPLFDFQSLEKSFIPYEQIKQYLSDISHYVTVLYRFRLTSDFSDLISKVTLRNLVCSTYPPREFYDYSNFDLKMAECLKNQKML